jgi:type VI secretion system secreted protein VgrG
MGSITDIGEEAAARLGGGVLPAVQLSLTIDGKVAAVPWKVSAVTLDEELSGGYRATIDVETESLDGDVEPLLGAEACLTLTRPGHLPRVVPGIIRGVTSHGRDGTGIVHCTLELEPAFACLDEGQETRRFQDETVPGILRLVLKERLGAYAREAELGRLTRPEDPGASDGKDTRDCFPRRPWCVQYGESAHDFARRLMAEEGLSYFFDEEGGRERLVIVDGNFAFPVREGKIPLRAGGMAADREAITSFSIRSSRAVGKVTLRAANLTSMSPDLESRAIPPRTEDYKPARQAKDPGGEELYDPSFQPTLFRYRDGAYEKNDLDTQARLRLEERRAAREVGRGAGFVVGLRAGLVVELDAGAGLGGKYLITKVRHLAQAPSQHRTWGGGGAVNYTNEFECIPVSVPFRPARLPKPVARGVDRAVVTAPADNQLWTDRHGRVTVQFLWDRDEDGPPDMTSYWVPVSTAWAGPGYGVQFVPRKGMEVVVGYVGGDPDQPIIVGCRESALNPLPVEMPKEATRSGIWTQSLRDGGRDHQHWSELSFDDEANHELVTLRAGWDYKRKVLHDDKTEIDHDEHRTIGNKQTVHVVGELDHTVDKDATVTVHGAQTTTIDKLDKRTITEGDEVLTIEKGSRSAEVKATDKLTVHGDREVIVEGSEQHHVAHKRTLKVDEVLTVKQGDTVVEWAEGHVDLSAQSWIKIRHAGAEVRIDDAGNVRISTDKQIEVGAPGATITLGDGKAAIEAAQELTLMAGTGALKLDASGAALSGNKVTSSGTTLNEITAMLVKVN